jgi:succinoglycan biosynthesis protein ExoV
MRLYYYKHKQGNFGDDINRFLWERLMPGVWGDDDGRMLSGIGTIIDAAMPKADQWIVFGSGVGQGPLPNDFGNNKWDIKCVRGPLSAKVLGLPEVLVGADPAILVSTLPEFKAIHPADRAGVAFMPHHYASEVGDWRTVCERAGIAYLDPSDDPIATIESIRRSRLVIADAMHAAIIADAMRVPWVPVVTSVEVNTFKWMDWTLSMQLPYRPYLLSQSNALEVIRNISMPLYGAHMYFEHRDEEEALRWFKANNNPRARFRKLWKRVGSGVFKRVIYPAVESRSFARLRRHYDEIFLNQAVSSLKVAAKHEGYLSSDIVFHNKILHLRSLVDSLSSDPRLPSHVNR